MHPPDRSLPFTYYNDSAENKKDGPFHCNRRGKLDRTIEFLIDKHLKGTEEERRKIVYARSPTHFDLLREHVIRAAC